MWVNGMISKKREEKALFLWGMAVGFICFLLMFGVKIVDVTYDAWIFQGDIDLRQHYIGWCHFRTSDWHFPLGMIDSLSYPYSVSVIWTDSIPLFALFFKLFRGILPETFQYLGLFTFLSFGLQGGLSAVLLRQVTDKKAVCMCGVFPFVLSFPILKRCFYHTALSAQWILVLALFIWFSGVTHADRKKKMLLWGGMSVLCVLIHSYFIPMTALIMVADFAEDYWKQREWKSSLFGFAAFVSAGLLTLFALGAFTGAVNTDYGLGGFNSNLNTLFNPLDHGALLKELPLATDFQYEGFGYLGAGILLLLMASVVLLVKHLVSEKITVRAIMEKHRRAVLMLAVMLVFFAAALYPEISLNEKILFRIPVPLALMKLFGFFRSNGRFIMPVVYLLMTAAMGIAGRFAGKRILPLLLTVCILLQAADLSGEYKKNREQYANPPQEYESALLQEEVANALSEYRHFVMMYDDVTDMMEVEYCAYRLGMTNNRFYYARDIDAQVETSLKAYRQAVYAGCAEKDCVFLFDEASYEEMKESGLYFCEVGDFIFGTVEPMEGKK